MFMLTLYSVNRLSYQPHVRFRFSKNSVQPEASKELKFRPESLAGSTVDTPNSTSETRRSFAGKKKKYDNNVFTLQTCMRHEDREPDDAQSEFSSKALNYANVVM